MGPDSYSAKLFSSSKVEDFFSLKGVARQYCRALRIRVGQMGELALADVMH